MNGKVVTTYLGQNIKQKSFLLNYKSFILSLIIILLISFLFFFSSNITGNVSLDIKSSYNKGEIIDGKLNLNLLEGEFIPADSKVMVSYGNISKEFNLSSLIAESAINGRFYT